jgi:hypothetical protein
MCGITAVFARHLLRLLRSTGVRVVCLTRIGRLAEGVQ